MWNRLGASSRVELQLDCGHRKENLEREKGFEPSTLALARRCSTTELFPLKPEFLRRDEFY